MTDPTPTTTDTGLRQVTEYAIFEQVAGAWQRLPTAQTFLSDRWYGDGDDARQGIDAAMRAMRRVREAVPGSYTIRAVRTFHRAAA